MPANHKKVDVIDKILEACYQAKPDALFIMSLMHQYEERGSLSKKQLEGLYLKASRIKDMPSNWLATLEATILKMPTRDKTPASVDAAPIFTKDVMVGHHIEAILAKYPQHKRVLFFQTKYNSKEGLSASELAELDKFVKLLLK